MAFISTAFPFCTTNCLKLHNEDINCLYGWPLRHLKEYHEIYNPPSPGNALSAPYNTHSPPINKSCLYTRTRNCFRFVGFTRPFLQSEGLIYIMYFSAQQSVLANVFVLLFDRAFSVHKTRILLLTSLSTPYKVLRAIRCFGGLQLGEACQRGSSFCSLRQLYVRNENPIDNILVGLCRSVFNNYSSSPNGL